MPDALAEQARSDTLNPLAHRIGAAIGFHDLAALVAALGHEPARHSMLTALAAVLRTGGVQ